MSATLFDVADHGDPDVTLGACPQCGCPEARIRPRPDTRHHAELRCPSCNHFRWLPKPRFEKGDEAMATATTSKASTGWEMEVGGGGGNGDYVCCPPGTFRGAIVGLFDIGHQSESNNGETKELRRLVMVLELGKKRPDGKPFVMAKRYTWSMNEKSNFYKDVCSITGKKFREGEKFNPLDLLGTPVMIGISNTQSGEKTYHDISSIAQFPEDMDPAEPKNRPVSWSVMSGEPFPAGLDWLPYVYGKSIKSLAEVSTEAKQRAAATKPDADEDDDNIPF